MKPNHQLKKTKLENKLRLKSFIGILAALIITAAFIFIVLDAVIAGLLKPF